MGSSLKDKIEKIADREGCRFIEALTIYMLDNKLTPAKVAKSIGPDLLELLMQEAKTERYVITEVLERKRASLLQKSYKK